MASLLNGGTLKALRGLHEAGWVHRDISSGNVLITTRGAVKLSDWEYAKELVNLPSETHDIRTVSSHVGLG